METQRERIVITGLGAVTPYGVGLARLEEGLFRGRSAIRPISGFDASPLAVRIAGEVPDFRPSDHLSRHSALRMDRFVQFAVTAVREALTNARLDLTKSNRDRVATV